jgi:hypothetical protein
MSPHPIAAALGYGPQVGLFAPQAEADRDVRVRACDPGAIEPAVGLPECRGDRVRAILRAAAAGTLDLHPDPRLAGTGAPT